MTGIVLDFMTAPAMPSVLVNHGVMGAAVYTDPLKWGWPKDVHADFLAEGLSIPGWGFVFIFEQGINNWQGGRAQGLVDGANWAQSQADRNLPDHTPGCPTYDTNIPPSEFPTALAYQEGFIIGCAPHPVVTEYAEGALIEALVGAGLAQMGWESESQAFYGNATPTVHTSVVQIANMYSKIPGLAGSYDYNQVLAHDWGQWPRPGAPPNVEEDMLAFPRLATQGDAWHGRDVALGFDPTTATLFLSNGGQFADTIAGFKVTQWPVGNTTGVSSTAQLVGAHNGQLDFGVDDSGLFAVVSAKGDGGTFGAPFKNVLPAPSPAPAPAPGPVPDLAALSSAVAARLKLATIE